MKIQVNSDKTIAVHAGLIRFVESEVSRVLGTFAQRLTRVEIHLSDVDGRKTGQVDKRCLIEVRPAGARPLSASAKATQLESALGEALGKTKRSLTNFFGRRGRQPVEVSGPISTTKSTKKSVVKKADVRKTATEAKKTSLAKKAAVKKPAVLSSRGPKKKRIYQARRKAWPTR